MQDKVLLSTEYGEFINSPEGQEWKRKKEEEFKREGGWIPELGDYEPGNFGDYIYDFHPEILM